MIVIGETLNSSIPKTYMAFDAWDEPRILAIIDAQVQAGADYLDINTAMLREQETDCMCRVIALARRHAADVGIMIDSQNPKTVFAAMELCRDCPVILNSATMDAAFDPILALAAECGCGLVCMPEPASDADVIVSRGAALAEKATRMGVKADKLYMDALAASTAADDMAGRRLLDTIAGLRAALPDSHILCGISNLSFGMPNRPVLNAAGLCMAAAKGLDSVILNAANPLMQETLAAVKLLAGEDSFGLAYINQMRKTE